MTGSGDRAGEQVFINAGDARLAGELWRPDGDLQAGVVLVGGSGPTERSNDGCFVAHRDQLPVEESAAAFTTAACATGRHPMATLTIHVVPGADHRLRTGADAAPGAHHLAYLCGWIKSALPA